MQLVLCFLPRVSAYTMAALRCQYGRKFIHQLYSRRISLCARTNSKLDLQDEEMQKTNMTLGSATAAFNFRLTSLVDGGFEFGDKVVNGPIAIVPGSIFKWKVSGVQDVNVKSLSLFTIFFPKLEIVILGTGDKTHRIDPEILAEMRKRGVSVEVQDTANACGTYNLLQAERPGLVAAALLPLKVVSTGKPGEIDRKKRSKPMVDRL